MRRRLPVRARAREGARDDVELVVSVLRLTGSAT